MDNNNNKKEYSLTEIFRMFPEILQGAPFYCPNEMGFTNFCTKRGGSCGKCWSMALNEDVK